MPNTGSFIMNGGEIESDGAGIVMRGGLVKIGAGAKIRGNGPAGFVGKVGDSKVNVGSYGIVYDATSNYPGVASLELIIKDGADIAGTDGDTYQPCFEVFMYGDKGWSNGVNFQTSNIHDIVLLRFADVKATIEKRCGWIAPIADYPGEMEQEALALPALKVMQGKLTPLTYTGKPVRDGFPGIEF